ARRRTNRNTGSSRSAQSVEQELTKLERRWIEAMTLGDTGALNQIMAGDYLSTNQDGTVSNKAQLIEEAKQGRFKDASFTSKEALVRVYGNTAVITSSDVIQGRIGGQAVNSELRHTSIWVKRQGQWQIIGWQGTPVLQGRGKMGQEVTTE